VEIQGKRVLVTGASRGLGRTLTFAFAAAGASEMLAGARNPEHLQSLVDEAAANGLRMTGFPLDVTVDEQVFAAAKMGPIDILVNNAGVAGFGNPLTMSFEDIQREVEVNYLGVLRMVRAIAPGMVAQRDGMIVNIATAFARINLPLVGTYCATKAALLSLGQALRAYLSDHGVRVMTVMPTTIDTDMSRSADVPKMTTQFVAGEILRSIREETHDPPIGDEAKEIFSGLEKDPLGLEKMLAKYK
jgi:short-subunit dehydrogenase